MKNRVTKQKQIILETLAHMDNHPTIAELYEAVLKKDPSIGQATVYRNVKKMIDQNQISRISFLGVDHYDGKTEEHMHLYCTKCGKMIDIYGYDLSPLEKTIEQDYHLRIQKQKILFEGVCKDCLKRRKNEEVSL